MALVVVVRITYQCVSNEGGDANIASIIALTTFLTLLPPEISTESGVVGGVIPRTWIGANGIITAILVAFFVSTVVLYCDKHNLGIKMPESVPTEIVRSFAALTPAFICFTTAAIIYGICHHLLNSTFPELIFKLIQAPLQGLSDTMLGGAVIIGLQSVLFWVGIHGPNAVGGVVNPLLLANTWENQQLLDMGQQLLGNPAAHIMTAQIHDVFTKAGGCGLTMGFLISSYIVGKSEQLKTVSKVSLVPGIFNVNEPIIFGLPIVFNPYMIIPFILAPILAFLITYTSILIGFMPPFGGMQVPWTTPPIISAFLLSGWRGAVVQTITVIVSTLVYLPFVKMQDRIFCEEENAQRGIVDDEI